VLIRYLPQGIQNRFLPQRSQHAIFAYAIFSPTHVGAGVTIIVSRMTVGLLAFEVGYSNRTTGDLFGRRISVEALDGPTRYLNACWRFEPRDEGHTRVHFCVSYEFRNPLVAVVASRVFTAMFAEIIDAFERRAAKLSRNRTLTATGQRR
jgi:ribosome-associated toxin RatA of RatAB toxin-antitoxin module